MFDCNFLVHDEMENISMTEISIYIFFKLKKLSRQKFHNELACVFTPHHASKNADRNQQQLKDGGILAIGTAQIIRIVSYPIRKSPHSGFLACDL